MFYGISKLEVPFMPYCRGELFGSASMIGHLATFGRASYTSRMKFSEARIGMIPNGGSTYMLSRLPAELGTYLALTGAMMRGSDLTINGITAKYEKHTVHFEENLAIMAAGLTYNPSFVDNDA
jgi:enoyl-CoA hydratase